MNNDALLKNCLDQTSIGLALIDKKHVVLEYNHVFETALRRVEPYKKETDYVGAISFVGCDFYKALGSPKFETQCYAPFYFAETERRTTRTLLSWGGPEGDSDGKEPEIYYELSVSCVFDVASREPNFLVELRDVTDVELKKRKARLLDRVSRDLLIAVAAKQRENLDDKKELLKTYVSEALRDVFNYDVFEIRIADSTADERVLRYFVGWNNVADGPDVLRARWNENGITGCVAVSREYYICDDTRYDAHYVKGAFPARSSMTVPLIVEDMLVGVCNVESEKPNAFTVEDAEFLTFYSRAVALALYFLNFLSDEFANLLFDCGRRIDDRLRFATSSILERSLELSKVFSNQEQGEVDHWEKREAVDSLVYDSLELSETIADLRRSLCCSDQRNDDFENASVYRFLAQSRVLVVGNNSWNYVRKLEELGACVDVVRTTSTALSALERCSYDLVISERNPDGTFFKQMKKSDKEGAPLNSRNLNVYDIHEEGYFEPAPGNPLDAAERERIKEELESGKGDAYFLYKSMLKLERNYRTLFLLAIDHEYDPTHVQVGLSKTLGHKLQPTFYSDTEIMKPVLKAIQKAMEYRAIREANQERLL